MRGKFMNRLIMFALTHLALSLNLQGQEITATTLGVTFGKALYIYSVDSAKKIYDRKGWVFDNSGIHSSPDGRYLAAIITQPDFKEDGAGHYYEDHELLMFSRSGTLLFSVPNAQTLAWSPNSDQIA